MDTNNIAPSVGVTWRPNIGDNWAAKILSADPVFRGGYSVSYDRYSTNDFINIFGNNPGQSRTASRSATTGTPFWGADGQGWPVLLRQPERIYSSTFPSVADLSHSRRRSTKASTPSIPSCTCRTRTSGASAGSVNSGSRWRWKSATSATRTSARGRPGT